MKQRRSRAELKLDRENHLNELEEEKASRAAVESFNRRAYPTYEVSQCLEKWGVNLKGGIAGGQKR